MVPGALQFLVSKFDQPHVFRALGSPSTREGTGQHPVIGDAVYDFSSGCKFGAAVLLFGSELHAAKKEKSQRGDDEK